MVEVVVEVHGGQGDAGHHVSDKVQMGESVRLEASRACEVI